jgi:hypothetical protein
VVQVAVEVALQQRVSILLEYLLEVAQVATVVQA